MAKKPKYKVIPYAGQSGISVPHSNAPVAIPYAGQGSGLTPQASAPDSRFFFNNHPPVGPSVPRNVAGTSNVDPSVFTSLPVAQQQELLARAGFNVAVDGQFGPQTQTARNAYLKGTPAATWNHAWAASHSQQSAASPVNPSQPNVRTTASAGTSGGGAAATPSGQSQTNPLSALLQQVLSGANYQPPSTQELLATARQIAQASLAPQLAANRSARQQAIYDQQFAQQQALQDAQRNAKFEQGVSAALANVLKSQGPATEAAYHQATQDTQALGQGFSEQFRQNADTSAAGTNEFLQSIGAPEGQMIDPTKARAAADVLYGVGGYLPGRTLAQQGAAFAGAANMLPATAVGRGQQLSADALRAGADARNTLRQQGLSEQNRLRNELAQIEAGRPKYVSDAMGQLQTQVNQNSALAQNQALFPLLLADKFDQFPGINPVTGAPTKPTRDALTDAAKAQANAAPKYNATVSRSLGYRADQYGNPMGGRYVALPGFKQTQPGVFTKTSTARGKTAKQLSPEKLKAFTEEVNSVVTGLRNGGKDPDTGKDLPAVGYNAAVRYLQQHGYLSSAQLAKIALAAMRDQYNYEGQVADGLAAGPPAP